MKTLKMRVERVEQVDGGKPRICLTSRLKPPSKKRQGLLIDAGPNAFPMHFDFECEPGMLQHYPVGSIVTIKVEPGKAEEQEMEDDAEEEYEHPEGIAEKRIAAREKARSLLRKSK